MKSIEALVYLDDIAHGRIMDYDAHELKLIVEKDLEVLAILKKYLGYNIFIIYLSASDIDIDEYKKVMKWLEEKKHDNKDGTDI